MSETSKIRLADPVIPIGKDENPFENCKLDRKVYSEALTKIITNYNDGFVLALNNKWGEGKTTFIKMWIQHLKNNEFTTLYFNAWENDFQKEVIIALLSELKELKNKGEETFSTVLKKTIPLVKKIAPGVIKHFAKKVVGEEALQEMTGGFGEYGIEQLQIEIDNFSTQKKSIKEFRDSLKEYVGAISPEKPLVFIIDELDRCRPSYAVEVLEQVKHLFLVNGIVFVLSIDKEQLGNAVKGFYGSNELDSNEYLRRFIDLEYSIPPANIQKFIDYLFDYYELENHFSDIYSSTQTFKHIANLIFKQNSFSLRQVEKVFIRMKLVIMSFKSNEYIHPDIILFLYFVKDQNSKIYNEIRKGGLSQQDFMDQLTPLLQKLANGSDNRLVKSLIAHLLYHHYFDFIRSPFASKQKLYDTTPDCVAKLTIKTDFENDENDLAKIISYLDGKDLLYGIQLSELINKFEIMEPIEVV